MSLPPKMSPETAEDAAVPEASALAQSPPEAPALPRPRLPAILRVVLYVAAVIALEIAIGSPTLAVLAALGLPEPSGTALGSFLLIDTALGLPFVFALTVFFLRVLDRRALPSIGLRWPEGGIRQRANAAGLGAIAAVALLVAWLGAITSQAEIHWNGWSSEVLESGALATALLLALHLVGFLIQGGFEELVARGYAYRALRERYGATPANLATSAVFALLHAGNPGATPVAIANTFLAGVVLAASVERTKSLLPATIAHGVWNFTIACILSVPVSGLDLFRLGNVEIAGPAAITGGAYGPEGSWWVQPLLLVVLWRVGRRVLGDQGDQAPFKTRFNL